MWSGGLSPSRGWSWRDCGMSAHVGDLVLATAWQEPGWGEDRGVTHRAPHRQPWLTWLQRGAGVIKSNPLQVPCLLSPPGASRIALAESQQGLGVMPPLPFHIPRLIEECPGHLVTLLCFSAPGCNRSRWPTRCPGPTWPAGDAWRERSSWHRWTKGRQGE